MRIWNLKVAPPLVFTLAADHRLAATDYTNDHIWELSLGGGDPPALALHTTFGLRARSLRIFPRFIEGTTTVFDPATFVTPLMLQAMAPNYLRLTFSPLPELLVTAEYWASTSQAIAGRFTLENHSAATRQLCLELATNLAPADGGQRMMPMELNAVSVLGGSTVNLQPVLFLNGGPRAEVGVYPSLLMDLTLSPRQQHHFIWAEAALATTEASFELAREIASRNWEAELAHIELINGGMVEVYTGDPQWDFVLALAQRVAFGLALSATDQFTAPSFVFTRLPDQGYSPRGDGSDYPPLWNGQTPLDTYVMINQILPTAPQFAAGLIRNFLATQGEEGFIDWKPGLSGQQSQIWATPLLVALVERIHQVSGDDSFLRECFPYLLAFVQGWMGQHDRDGDGIPEWEHPVQTGFDDHPLFTKSQDGMQGAEIGIAEGPDLCAYLYNECQALKRIAAIIDRSEAVMALQGFVDNLSAAADASWDGKDSSYHYWDRDSHRWTRSEFLGALTGPGEIILRRRFDPPIRLLACLEIADEQGSRPLELFVDGEGASGQHRVERIGSDSFRWRLLKGQATGERVYTSIDRIEVRAIGADDRISLYTVGLDGLIQTLFLPLWARMPSGERAEQLVVQTLTNPDLFWRPYGVCASIPSDTICGETLRLVHFSWNLLLGEGLLAYGYRSEAASLFSRLMQVAIESIQRDGVFRRFYHADTGLGSGEANALTGLPPLGLFLDTLGVRILSPWKVALAGINPFPWPVTVKYRGLTLLRQSDKTTLVFPDGQTVVINKPTPCVVVNDCIKELVDG